MTSHITTSGGLISAAFIENVRTCVRFFVYLLSIATCPARYHGDARRHGELACFALLKIVCYTVAQ